MKTQIYDKKEALAQPSTTAAATTMRSECGHGPIQICFGITETTVVSGIRPDVWRAAIS